MTVKYKLETGGTGGCSFDDGYYDPGYIYLELWKLDESADKWVNIWESSYMDGDDLEAGSTIKKEFIEIMPEFGLTPEDISDFDTNCIFDWEIKNEEPS